MNIKSQDNKFPITYKTNTASSLFCLLFSLVFIILSLIKINSDSIIIDDWSREVSISIFIWLSIYAVCIKKMYRSLYLFSNAYVCVVILFHLGGFYIDFFGGDVKFDNRFGDIQPWVVLAGWYVLLALASFSFGISVVSATSKVKYVSIEDAQKLLIKSKGTLLWASIGLLAASLFFFVLMLKSYGNLAAYSRHELFGSTADSRGLGVFMMIFPGAVVAFFYCSYDSTSRLKYTGIFLCIIAFLLFMVSGYRSAALFPSLVAVVCWIKQGRKIPNYIAVAIICSILVLISAAGELRNKGAYEDIGVDDIGQSFAEADATKSIASMGNSITALAHTLRLVPSKEQYRHGRSYLRAMLGMFPNIGFEMQHSKGRQALKKESRTDKSAFLKMSPSDWLTWNILNEQFDSGGGTGFSAVAEPYFNFGAVGVIVIFILIGMFFGFLDLIKIQYSPVFFIFCTSMLWPLMRTCRNDFSNFLKPFGFACIILLIWWCFSRLFISKGIFYKFARLNLSSKRMRLGMRV